MFFHLCWYIAIVFPTLRRTFAQTPQSLNGEREEEMEREGGDKTTHNEDSGEFNLVQE